MITYGLVGKSLKHSFSKRYFEERYGFNLNPDAPLYLNFEITDIRQMRDIVAENSDISGFNVTIPYKTQVLELLDELSPAAHEIGAVNVVKIIRDPFSKKSIWRGYNTDYLGFKEAISPMINHHRAALVLGNGGASVSIRYAMEHLGVQCTCACRTPQSNLDISFDKVDNAVIRSHQIIINTTPLGTWPEVNSMPPIPLDHINEEHLVFDLVYNPEETLLMREAKKRGATTSNGLIMLRKQADLSLEIWEQSQNN